MSILLPLLLATSVTVQTPLPGQPDTPTLLPGQPDTPTEIHIPFACQGHWQQVTPDHQGRGILYVYAKHVTVTDKKGNKVGETDDKGGTFKCVDSHADNDGDDSDSSNI